MRIRTRSSQPYFENEMIWRGFVLKATSDLRRAILAVGLLISAICAALAAIKLWPDYSPYTVLVLGFGGAFYFWANYDAERKWTTEIELDLEKAFKQVEADEADEFRRELPRPQ